MGKERQRKKARSGLPKVRPHARSQASQRGAPRDDLVSSHWDRKATLSQNYRRLGLASNLTPRRAGGVEPAALASAAKTATNAPLASSGRAKTKSLIGTEVKVRRDPKTGAIVKVLHEQTRRPNPLGDLLVDMDEDEDEEEGEGEEQEEQEKPGIIRELEEKAARVATKQPRKQSQREQEWIERLVAKHGDNYAAMARDRKVNPMQQTAADISRRVRKWQVTQSQGSNTAAVSG